MTDKKLERWVAAIMMLTAAVCVGLAWAAVAATFFGWGCGA